MRISAVLVAALLTTGGLAAAQRAQASIRHYQLDIPRQSLDSAIKDLAQQTGLQIARFSDTIDGDILVGPVKGNRTPEEALRTLLTRDLRYKVVNDTTIAIIDAKDDRSGDFAPRITDSSGTSPLGSTKAPHMLLASDAEPLSPSAPSGTGAAGVGEQSDRDAHGTAPLSEIVVTANKLNTQRVLDIPTSIQACGGVAVFPNDIVVADQDGAVLIPQALLDHVLAEGPEQERMEAWIVNEVNNGAALPGLYPMNAETKARYAASKK